MIIGSRGDNITNVFTKGEASPMRRLFNEAIKIIEDDVRWLHDAAQRFEEIAHSLPKSQRASWILLTDMYDERANIHARLAVRMRRASHP